MTGPGARRTSRGPWAGFRAAHHRGSPRFRCGHFACGRYGTPPPADGGSLGLVSEVGDFGGGPTLVGYGVAEADGRNWHRCCRGCAPGLVVTNIDNGYGRRACAADLAILEMEVIISLRFALHRSDSARLGGFGGFRAEAVTSMTRRPLASKWGGHRVESPFAVLLGSRLKASGTSRAATLSREGWGAEHLFDATEFSRRPGLCVNPVSTVAFFCKGRILLRCDSRAARVPHVLPVPTPTTWDYRAGLAPPPRISIQPPVMSRSASTKPRGA